MPEDIVLRPTGSTNKAEYIITTEVVAPETIAALSNETDYEPGVIVWSGQTGTTLAAPASYTPIDFTNDGTSFPTFTLGTGLAGYSAGGYFDPSPTNNSHIFTLNQGYARLKSNNAMEFFSRDGAGAITLAGQIPNAIKSSVTHLVWKVDFTSGTPVVTCYQDGVDISNTVIYTTQAAGASTVQGGTSYMFSNATGNNTYLNNFSELFLDEGVGLDISTVFGTPDPATLNPTYLLGGSGQRALGVAASETPNMNNGEHNGTAADFTFTTAVTAGNEPFSEV